MKRSSFEEMECPIARALEEIGEWWSLLILREVLLGARQFGELQGRLGIATSTLTRRLDALVASGLLAREPQAETPSRHDYVATAKGEALLPVLLALATWGNRWVFGPGKEPLLAVDAESGAPLQPEVVDRATSRPLVPGEVRLVAGPGASALLRRQLASVGPRVLGRPRRAASTSRT